MTRLLQSLYQLLIALGFVLGLTVLPVITSQVFGDEIVDLIPGISVVLANECDDGTCG